MQACDQFGGLDVDWGLVAKGPALHADDKPELPDLPQQVGEGEARLLPLVAVEKIEALEVTA